MASKTALYAMQFFMNKGYSPVAAAGIVGNLDHESNLNPNIGGDPDRNGRMRATGIAQWWPDRWANLNAWANKQGLNPRSLDAQLGFVDHELRTRPQVFARVSGAKTVRDAAAAFGLGYESPKGSETGVAENMHGWGSRLGRAVNFASLATGKPMSEFAASGWTPPAPGAPGTPAAPAQQEVAFDLGAPPIMPDVQDDDAQAVYARTDTGGGYDETDLSDLYGMTPVDSESAAPLDDPVSMKVASIEQQRKMTGAPEPTEMNLADVFQAQNINLQKIGAARQTPAFRKMSVG